MFQINSYYAETLPMVKLFSLEYLYGRLNLQMSYLTKLVSYYILTKGSTRSKIIISENIPYMTSRAGSCVMCRFGSFYLTIYLRNVQFSAS